MCLKPHLNLNEVYYYHEELYSLKFGMELKRGKIQSFSSKHGKKRKALIKKYSYREKNRVLDYVDKFVNKLLNMYSMTMFSIC